MIALLRGLPDEERARLAPETLTREPSPILAVLAPEPFSDPEWIFEPKLDGERVLAVCDGEELRLVSRNGKDVSGSYPEIPDALRASWRVSPEEPTDVGGHAALPAFVLDGEIVAFEETITSFSRLQERMRIDDPVKARESPVPVYYYLFDFLHLDGYGLVEISLRTRKHLLKEVVSFSDPLRFTPHRDGEGEALHREACRKGWEGVMAKRASSSYLHARSSEWLKLKCVNRQELVIGGYTEPRGTRTGFGALLVGHYEDGELRLCRQGRHRLRRADPGTSRSPPSRQGTQDLSVLLTGRPQPRQGGRTLGHPCVGRPVRVHGVDGVREAEAPPLPRTSAGQGSPRGGTRGAPWLTHRRKEANEAGEETGKTGPGGSTREQVAYGGSSGASPPSSCSS